MSIWTRAGLCLAGLLTLLPTLTAKPPDLPLPFQDSVSPQVQGEGDFVQDLFPMSTTSPVEPETPTSPPAGPVYRLAPMARPMFQLPASVRRSLAECLLFGVHPLMLLVPVGDCLDAPGDHPAPPKTETPPLLSRVQEAPTGGILWGFGVNSDAGLTGSFVANDPQVQTPFRVTLGLAARGTDGDAPRFSRKLWGLHPVPWDWPCKVQTPCSPTEQVVPVEVTAVGRTFQEREIGISRFEEQITERKQKGEKISPDLQAWWEALVLRLPEENAIGETENLSTFLGLLNGDFFYPAAPEPIRVMPHKEEGKLPCRERDLQYQLSLPVTLNFTKAPLHQVLDDIRSAWGLNLFLDKEALEAEDVCLDRPMTLHLTNLSLQTALTLLLKQARLAYCIQDGVVRITTEAAARGRLMTRTYPVADLMDADVSALLGMDVPPWIKLNKEETLVSFVTYNVLPRSWADVGGAATIEFHAPTQSLVVNQTPAGQEEVEGLLALVRKQTREWQERKKEADPKRVTILPPSSNGKPIRLVRTFVVLPRNDPRILAAVQKAVAQGRQNGKGKLCVLVEGKVVGEEASEEEQEPRTLSRGTAKSYQAEGKTLPSRAKGITAAEDKAGALHLENLLDGLGHFFKEGGCAEVGIGTNGLRFRGQVHLNGCTYHLRFGSGNGVCVWTMMAPPAQEPNPEQQK
jgi:hypothetical protein